MAHWGKRFLWPGGGEKAAFQATQKVKELIRLDVFITWLKNDYPFIEIMYFSFPEFLPLSQVLPTHHEALLGHWEF